METLPDFGRKHLRWLNCDADWVWPGFELYVGDYRLLQDYAWRRKSRRYFLLAKDIYTYASRSSIYNGDGTKILAHGKSNFTYQTHCMGHTVYPSSNPTKPNKVNRNSGTCPFGAAAAVTGKKVVVGFSTYPVAVAIP